MNGDSESEGPPPLDQRLAPWEVLERQELLARPPWLQVQREQVRLPSGRVVDDFYRILLPEFALVVPRTADGRYVMVRGYKHGAGQVALSPPAGIIQPGESPQAAAARELLEETGYRARDWRFVARMAADGNRQCGIMHLFLAEGAERVAAPQDDDTEVLIVELMSADELLSATVRGEVATLAAAAGIGMALALRVGRA